jgi:hypothetical protein
VPATTVLDAVQRRTLVQLQFVEGRFTRTVGVVHRRGRVLSPPARAFVEMVTGRT